MGLVYTTGATIMRGNLTSHTLVSLRSKPRNDFGQLPNPGFGLEALPWAGETNFQSQVLGVSQKDEKQVGICTYIFQTGVQIDEVS